MESGVPMANARKGSSCGLDRIHSSDGAVKAFRTSQTKTHRLSYGRKMGFGWRPVSRHPVVAPLITSGRALPLCARKRRRPIPRRPKATGSRSTPMNPFRRPPQQVPAGGYREAAREQSADASSSTSSTTGGTNAEGCAQFGLTYAVVVARDGLAATDRLDCRGARCSCATLTAGTAHFLLDRERHLSRAHARPFAETDTWWSPLGSSILRPHCAIAALPIETIPEG